MIEDAIEHESTGCECYRDVAGPLGRCLKVAIGRLKNCTESEDHYAVRHSTEALAEINAIAEGKK